MSKQKRKGDSYERELAKYFNDHIFSGEQQVFRAPLSGGGAITPIGGSDLLGCPGLFVEAKRYERLPLWEAIRQAERNRKLTHSPELPIVITRKNNMKTGESLCILRFDDFLEFYKTWVKVNGYEIERPRDTTEEQLNIFAMSTSDEG